MLESLRWDVGGRVGKKRIYNQPLGTDGRGRAELSHSGNGEGE